MTLLGECERYTASNGREVTSCLPSQLVVSPLYFRKIVTLDDQIWNWRDLVVNGRLTEARQDCGILMFDRAYRPVMVFFVNNAWPASVTLKPEGTMEHSLHEAHSANGQNKGQHSQGKFLYEEIVIVHEGLKRDGQPLAQVILAP